MDQALPARPTTRPVADEVAPIVRAFLGDDAPMHLTCWDGSTTGDPGAAVHVRINSRLALRRLLWDPNELGLGRAYVAGDIDIEGSIFDLLVLRDQVGDRDEDVALHLSMPERVALIGTVRRLGALGRRPEPPPEEARLRGRRHSKPRDAAAIGHHYDVGNDFYRLVLGPTMTYSCAYFSEPETDLDQAQEHKYELICRKLELAPGMRLLDVGCGWGGMVMHAARHHGVDAVGITISEQQAALARKRIAEAGLGDRVEIRLQDYRDVHDGPYDAISSIGMFEHVGIEQLTTYLAGLHRLLRPGGRLLNHAISRPQGEGRLDPDSFVARYVFPDGQLHEVGRVVSALQDHGFECRSVESLREHYARTLRPGSPTWRTTGTPWWPMSASHGLGSGGSTWPVAPSASRGTGRASTRSSSSAPSQLVPLSRRPLAPASSPTRSADPAHPGLSSLSRWASLSPSVVHRHHDPWFRRMATSPHLATVEPPSPTSVTDGHRCRFRDFPGSIGGHHDRNAIEATAPGHERQRRRVGLADRRSSRGGPP